MKTASASDDNQDEFPFSSIQSHVLFPGRTTLYVAEVAKALGASEQQVIDLIEDRKLAALDISSGLKTSETHAAGNKTPRAYWRIPVSAFDAFVAKRKNQ